MVQMDGVGSEDSSKSVIVLAATNRPWDLDDALRRRLEKRIYIPLPTKQGREDLFRINMKQVALAEVIDINYILSSLQIVCIFLYNVCYLIIIVALMFKYMMLIVFYDILKT